jgi:hypothetical protein
MMPHVSKDIIPDIFIPAITVKSEIKYESILKERIKNVSVIALAPKNLAYLKRKLVKKPKNTPIASETKPSRMN